MYDELIAELLAPWRADFALQPKTPSERQDAPVNALPGLLEYPRAPGLCDSED